MKQIQGFNPKEQLTSPPPSVKIATPERELSSAEKKAIIAEKWRKDNPKEKDNDNDDDEDWAGGRRRRKTRRKRRKRKGKKSRKRTKKHLRKRRSRKR